MFRSWDSTHLELLHEEIDSTEQENVMLSTVETNQTEQPQIS